MKNDEPERVIKLFESIENPDEVVFTLLFNACAQLPSNAVLQLLKRVSSTIPQPFRTNSILVTSLLDAMRKCGDVRSAETIFLEHKDPSVSMYGAMMKVERDPPLEYFVDQSQVVARIHQE